MKKITIMTLVCATALILTACGDDNKITDISLSKESYNLMTTDDPIELDLSIQPDGLDKISLTWESSDINVVTVDGDKNTSNGIAHATITPSGEGSAEITVTSKNGCSSVCSISVREPIPVETIKLIPNNSMELITGESQILNTKVKPLNADNQTLTYKSSNPEVASVDDSGDVKAIKPGNTVITITSSNGVTAECSVDVREPIEVQSIELSETDLEVYTQMRYTTISCTVFPNDADDKKVLWRSSDAGVASVNSEGRITPHREGSTVITVTSSNGKQASCNLTVKALTEEILDDLLKTQPLYVSSTKYIVQSDQWKNLYPDMLQAVIYNAGNDNIRSAVVAFVAWDQNNLPVNIVGSGFDLHGSYLRLVDYSGINLVPGGTYGGDGGFEIDERSGIAKFKACVVSYETFDGTTYENPYYEYFASIYAGNPLDS